MTPVDLRDYLTLPPLTMPRLIALGRALISSAPAVDAPVLGRARAQLSDAAAALEAAWTPLHDATPSQRKPADVALDNAWGAVEQRVDAWRRVADFEPEQAARAASLHGKLFPTGLSFLTLPYRAQWTQSEQRLQRVDAEGLTDEVEALAGPAFLAALRQAHAVYGEVLGITSPSDRAEATTAAGEAARTLRAAIQSWATRLIAHTDDQDADAMSALRAALHPIDEVRAEVRAASTR